MCLRLRADGRKAERKLDRALKGLQSWLGDLNDMRVHLDLVRNFAQAGTAAQTAFAIGCLAGREEATASDMLVNALAAGRDCGRRRDSKVSVPQSPSG